MNLEYLAEKKHFPFFFDEALLSKTTKLSAALGEHIQTRVYPDATLKNNGLPTGIAYYANEKNTLLLPFVLRDPGCGFLIFKLEFKKNSPPSWHKQAGDFLENLINQETTVIDINKKTWLQILSEGLPALNLPTHEFSKFSTPSFKIPELTFTTEEMQTLKSDLGQLTNTLEVRQISDIQNPGLLASYTLEKNSYVGFIHSGSFCFPKLLAKRFVYNVADYASNNAIFSEADIENKIFGVPLSVPLGQEYFYYLQAAMNYAVCSRYLIFKKVKQTLEKEFHCSLTLLSDNMHAGVFQQTQQNETIVYSTRGVQPITNLSLVAGHRETIAALVTPGSRAKQFNHLLAHGTSCNIRNDYNYSAHFSTQDAAYYLELAQNTYYNSAPQFNECIPYTFNLQTALTYFQEIGLTEPLATLAPLINIQSEWLKNP